MDAARPGPPVTWWPRTEPVLQRLREPLQLGLRAGADRAARRLSARRGALVLETRLGMLTDAQIGAGQRLEHTLGRIGRLKA